MSELRKRRTRWAALAAGSLLAGVAAAGVLGIVDSPDNRDFSVDNRDFSVEAAPAGHHDNGTTGHFDGGAAPAGHVDGG